MTILPRISALRASMDEQCLAALLVLGRDNIRYLSGFSAALGDAALLITADQQYLISDFRYREQAEQQSPAFRFELVTDKLMKTVGKLIERFGVSNIGFSPDEMTVAQYRLLQGEGSSPLQPAASIVEQLRMVKDPQELAAIREAARLTDAACAHVMSLAKAGATERDLAMEAEWYMRRQGADGVAFDIIVAAGAQSALPHAEPGERMLQPGDLLVVDMGARYQGYCADLTRTVAIEFASEQAQQIYAVCWAAQHAGLQQIHAGMSGRAADAVVRSVIEEAGFGEQFGHGTGHGVGLEVHEAPRLRRTSEELLPDGAVVTVEPGIYLAGCGGVRIEDLVVVREHGVEVISAAPKPAELPVIC
jgi:Xaa-Pro aminopeptidase